MKLLFDELSFENEEHYIIEEECEVLFDNSYQDKEYVICGTLGLWDGNYEVHSDKVFDSIYDAICECWTEGYIKVYEGKYGKLIVKELHHDGTNVFEIKELTPLGSELLNNYCENIFKRKGATKNARFTKTVQ